MKKKSLQVFSFHFLFLIALAFCLSVMVVPFTPPAPLAAAELKAIQKRGRLIVAVKDNLPPLGFRDSTGNLQGLEIEIARRLAAEMLGSPDAVELQPVANQDRLSVVLNGKVDLTIAVVTATETRGRLVDFSEPYYMDGTGFVTKDASVRRLEDVGKQTIAMLDNSDSIANVLYFLPNAKLVGVDAYEAGRMLIERGEAGVFAGDASVLAGWVQEYPDYQILPFLISAEPLSIVMPKGLQYSQLRLRVDDAMRRWTAEGWLRERAKYWGLPVPQD